MTITSQHVPYLQELMQQDLKVSMLAIKTKELLYRILNIQVLVFYQNICNILLYPDKLL